MAGRMCLFWCLSCSLVAVEMTSLREWNHQRVCGWPGNAMTSSKKKKLKVEETSGNIFLDRTWTNRSLETVYYVTDLKQQTDFFWSRDSGVRINIGLQDIQLIGSFEDVEHTSDNQFIKESPSFSNRKEYYTRIWKNFCRHPIPPGYTLTFELSLDRTTKASEDKCSEEMWLSSLCPTGSKPGQSFVRRTLNEPCTHVGSYPEPLNAAPNSLVCLEDTHLLSHVFNVTMTSQRTITETSKNCQLSSEGCDQCQVNSGCSLTKSDNYCCDSDCLSTTSCRNSFSCQSGPTICSMGDAYRLTIVPLVSQNLLDFRCHLRRVRPSLLYRYWFYVSIPDLNFETPKLFDVLPSQDRDIDSGMHTSYFFKIEYNSGIVGLNGDVIISHKESNKSKTFTLHSLRKSAETNQRFVSHSMSNHIKVTQIQFSPPFAYSTSNWNQSCFKNLSLFQPSSGKQPSPHGVKVDVKVERSHERRSAFVYHVKSLIHRPYVKIMIPGNQSVLRWWFYRNNISFIPKLIGASFRAEEKSWQLNLTGKVQTCPNYMNIICVDVEENEKMFDIDVVVLCPPLFSFTLSIPVSQSKSWPGKILKLTAESSTGREQFIAYLTFLPFVGSTHSLESQMLGSRSFEGREDEDEEEEEEEEEWSLRIDVKIFLIISVVAGFLLSSIYVSMTIASRKIQRFKKVPMEKLLVKKNSAKDNSRKTKHRLSLVIFFFQLLHGIIFTFSGFILIVLCKVPSPSKLHKSYQLSSTCSHQLHPLPPPPLHPHHLHHPHHHFHHLQCSPYFELQHLTEVKGKQELLKLNSSLASCERYVQEFLSKLEDQHDVVLSTLEENAANVESTSMLKEFKDIVETFLRRNLMPVFLGDRPPTSTYEYCSIGRWIIPGDDGLPLCIFPQNLDINSTKQQLQLNKYLQRRINSFPQVVMPEFPSRIKDSKTYSRLKTSNPKSHSSVKYFSVVGDFKKSFSVDEFENLLEDVGKKNESDVNFSDAFCFVFWYRVFTFFDLILLIKRVSATYVIYKQFFIDSKTFAKQTSNGDRSDRRIGSGDVCSPEIIRNTCSVYSAGLPGGATIRTDDIGILGEKEGYPVKTIMAAVTLLYLGVGWGMVRDSLLMMILRSEMVVDSSNDMTTSDILLDRNFLGSYHQLTVFDFRQTSNSFVLLQDVNNRLIPANRSPLKKLHDHRVNTTHECLFNSCSGHYRQTNASSSSSSSSSSLLEEVMRGDPLEALKSSFIDVMSSVVMTTASFVIAEVISGSVMSALMLFCCQRRTTHFTTIDPRNFTTIHPRNFTNQNDRIEQREKHLTSIVQKDLKLLETHV